ncbi:MAG: hypothetical protein M3352_11675 [Bacteroidota bacterium]|jgi:hypothetical protein|nr:hypothetical protein [Bacteroidota bacterium]
MGLLTPKGKKGDKKSGANQKNNNQGSKFNNTGVKTKGFTKKQMPGSANRGS